MAGLALTKRSVSAGRTFVTGTKFVRGLWDTTRLRRASCERGTHDETPSRKPCGRRSPAPTLSRVAIGSSHRGAQPLQPGPTDWPAGASCGVGISGDGNHSGGLARDCCRNEPLRLMQQNSGTPNYGRCWSPTPCGALVRPDRTHTVFSGRDLRLWQRLGSPRGTAQPGCSFHGESPKTQST